MGLDRLERALVRRVRSVNPEAPVDIEPFTPVILGTKQVANFTTHSMPSTGTYLIGVFFVGLLAVLILHLVVGRRRAALAEKQTVAEKSEVESEVESAG